MNLRKTTLPGGFFVFRQEITLRKKGSQEDPFWFESYTELSLHTELMKTPKQLN
jgi:hypothetical protein